MSILFKKIIFKLYNLKKKKYRITKFEILLKLENKKIKINFAPLHFLVGKTGRIQRRNTVGDVQD